MCGSDEIKDCFKFVFIQEESELEGFVRKVTEWRNGLHEKIANFGELIEEGQGRFSDFDVPAADGMECLVQAEARNGVFLEAVTNLLDVLLEAIPEKRNHGMIMEVHD